MLKRLKDGSYQIQTTKDAIEAVELRQELKEAINEAEQDAVAVTKALAEFMRKSNLPDFKAGEYRAKFVRRTQRFWDAERLKEIVRDEFDYEDGDSWQKLWQSLTVRIPDSEKINQAVAAKDVELDDIQDAYVEIPGNEYLDIRKVADDAEGR
jgi:hypothetical protein